MDTYTSSEVLELPWLDRLLLWSIRVWSAYHDDPSAVRWCLERAFVDAGIRPALEPFEKMMRSVFDGSKRWPSIRCVRCLRLSADERELLAVFADMEHGREQRAVSRLMGLLVRPQSTDGAVVASQVTAAFKQAGLSMQHADSEPTAARWPPAATVFSELRF